MVSIAYLVSSRGRSAAELARRETVALVGESGAGKSTVGNAITRIHAPTSGTVRYRGADVHALAGDDLAEYRRSVQMVSRTLLQPRPALPRRPVHRRTARDPTDPDEEARTERVVDLLETVNLDPAFRRRYPHELSGGQLQRVSVATALSVDPEFLVLDEPVSALDVSVQARILNLLVRLQRDHGPSSLFISHDLSVVRHLSDRVAVMPPGEIVEQGPTEDLFARPRHPYTEGLLASVPRPNPHARRTRRRLEGEIPSPLDPPPGCSFHPRRAYTTEACRNADPPLEAVADGREVACFHWVDVGVSATPDAGD